MQVYNKLPCSKLQGTLKLDRPHLGK
jgi:hypothetical protein